MGPNGRQEKLVIKAYQAEDYSGQAVSQFEAFLNPGEITFAYEIDYAAQQGLGTTNTRANFLRVKPGDLTIAFFLDGTGASGQLMDVTQAVAQFQLVTGYTGDEHRPHYLTVGWGTLPIRKCVLKSASIAYKLFRPDGSPLRAVISATFTERVDDQTRVAVTGDKSPDLTHVHLVKAGETLPALCQKFYGDVAYYTDVAAFNKLNNFRQLEPGIRLIFPPLRN
ncbi:MAG: hypothetical protein ABI852_07310 [Gemmatimonadaceae bacterium]